MNLILVIIILLLLFGGLGGGYYAHNIYGGWYGPGIGIGAILLIILLFILPRGY